MTKLQKRAITAIIIITTLIALVTFVIGPYVIGRGILGKTPLDNPSFSIQNMQLSKNDTTCYVSSTVRDTGNVWIAMLTLKLNQTYVWDDGWTAPAQDDLNRQVFINYGDLHCADIAAGQTYIASFKAHFADGVDLNATTTIRVEKYPIYWY